MKAGAAQIDLKPIPGHAVRGQMLRRTAVLVHDPLYASALALESRGEALLFIACDLLVLPPV
ncbi:MAG TPA: hypothetical protein VHR86_10575, partial [Armatimonadota bacterium]|nr:hypothetical protein [Armatimonadota bacterium]